MLLHITLQIKLGTWWKWLFSSFSTGDLLNYRCRLSIIHYCYVFISPRLGTCVQLNIDAWNIFTLPWFTLDSGQLVVCSNHQWAGNLWLCYITWEEVVSVSQSVAHQLSSIVDTQHWHCSLSLVTNQNTSETMTPIYSMIYYNVLTQIKLFYLQLFAQTG